jgi:hypothetical protein
LLGGQQFTAPRLLAVIPEYISGGRGYYPLNNPDENIMNRTGLYLIYTLNIAFIFNLMAFSTSGAADLKTVEFLGLQSTLPAAWIEQEPSSSMRLAQFRVPGAESEGDANLILYYFGQGQGGSAEANIARWKSQFSNPGGGAVEPGIETMQVNNMPVTVVELRGDYARSVGMGPTGTAAPDQVLLASIVEAPRGNIYVQLHGPAVTVLSQRGSYMAFIRSITQL